MKDSMHRAGTRSTLAHKLAALKGRIGDSPFQDPLAAFDRGLMCGMAMTTDWRTLRQVRYCIDRLFAHGASRRLASG